MLHGSPAAQSMQLTLEGFLHVTSVSLAALLGPAEEEQNKMGLSCTTCWLRRRALAGAGGQGLPWTEDSQELLK